MQHYIYASLHVDAARRFYQTKVEEARIMESMRLRSYNNVGKIALKE